jgi:hypothetical protein
VFNTVPNTSKVDESIDFIGKSSSLQEGVRVIGRKWGGEAKIYEKSQEEPGNGHGKGEGLDLDERTKALTDGFAAFLNPQNTLTPHLCRKGCKHYDGGKM